VINGLFTQPLRRPLSFAIKIIATLYSRFWILLEEE
jgi:hypothetical protein